MGYPTKGMDTEADRVKQVRRRWDRSEQLQQKLRELASGDEIFHVRLVVGLPGEGWEKFNSGEWMRPDQESYSQAGETKGLPAELTGNADGGEQKKDQGQDQKNNTESKRHSRLRGKAKRATRQSR